MLNNASVPTKRHHKELRGLDCPCILPRQQKIKIVRVLAFAGLDWSGTCVLDRSGLAPAGVGLAWAGSGWHWIGLRLCAARYGYVPKSRTAWNVALAL